MKLQNPEKYIIWRENYPSGNADIVFNYAELWANNIEGYLDCGHKLEDIAEMCGNMSKTPAIQGYMQNAAIAVLARCWVHGKELYQWYLKKQLKEALALKEMKKANNPYSSLSGREFLCPIQF